MTREMIEGSIKLSPLAKLMVEWMARRPVRSFSAREIGTALGMLAARVAEESSALRIAGVCLRKDKERDLPLAELMLAPEVRAAYVPASTQSKKDAA